MGAQEDRVVEPHAIGRWSRELEELHRPIGHRFARSEARERVKRYLVGLLGRVEPKNGWQLAQAIGERDPQGVQTAKGLDRQTTPRPPRRPGRHTLGVKDRLIVAGDAGGVG